MLKVATPWRRRDENCWNRGVVAGLKGMSTRSLIRWYVGTVCNDVQAWIFQTFAILDPVGGGTDTDDGRGHSDLHSAKKHVDNFLLQGGYYLL